MKKTLFVAIVLIATLITMPVVYAASKYGTVTDITQATGDSLTKGKGSIQTIGDTTTIKYSAATFEMLEADKDAADGDRPGPAAWIGFKVHEPEDGDSSFKVTDPTNNTTQIKKDEYSDFVGITPTNLKNALLKGNPLRYSYSFDWDEDDTDDQFVVIEIDPKEITLQDVDGDSTVWSPEIAKNVLNQNQANPDTSDINLFAVILLIIAGSCGLLYTYNKKFN